MGGAKKKTFREVNVRYRYQPGKIESGRGRATDPVRSLKAQRIKSATKKTDEPVLYYLQDRPKRDFVREELTVYFTQVN